MNSAETSMASAGTLTQREHIHLAFGSATDRLARGYANHFQGLWHDIVVGLKRCAFHWMGEVWLLKLCWWEHCAKVGRCKAREGKGVHSPCALHCTALDWTGLVSALYHLTSDCQCCCYAPECKKVPVALARSLSHSRSENTVRSVLCCESARTLQSKACVSLDLWCRRLDRASLQDFTNLPVTWGRHMRNSSFPKKCFLSSAAPRAMGTFNSSVIFLCAISSSHVELVRRGRDSTRSTLLILFERIL